MRFDFYNKRKSFQLRASTLLLVTAGSQSETRTVALWRLLISINLISLIKESRTPRRGRTSPSECRCFLYNIHSNTGIASSKLTLLQQELKLTVEVAKARSALLQVDQQSSLSFASSLPLLVSSPPPHPSSKGGGGEERP